MTTDTGALTFAEELILVLLDEKSGALMPVPLRRMNLGLAGAVLMDLQLANRIDTDLDTLTLTDATPLGDAVIDPTLAAIAGHDGVRDAAYWVERTAVERGEDIRDRAIARLVERNILDEPQGDGVIALTRDVQRTRRYPMADGRQQEEIRLRMMRILFGNDIPDPREIAIIGLTNACDIFSRLLSPAELKKVDERIDVLSRMDLVGRAVASLIKFVDPDARSGASSRFQNWPIYRGIPVLGAAVPMMTDVVGFATKQYKRLGPIFGAKALGQRHVFLAGLEANLAAQSLQDTHLSVGDFWMPFRKEFGARNFLLFGMDGPDHIRLRQEMKDGMSRSYFADRIPEALDVMRRQIARWPVGRRLRGTYSCQGISNAVIGALMASASSSEYLDDIIFFVRKVMTRMIVPSPLTIDTPRFRRARRRMIELCRKILADHQLRRHGRKPDMVDNAIDLHHRDPVSMPESDLMIAALIPFIVGLDTVAASIAAAVWVLLTRKDLQERVRAEADALFANGVPTVQQIREMDVTRRVVLETLRMYGVLPGLRRYAVTSFDFGDYRIPAGEWLTFVTAVTHRLPEYFPEPERFDIDRYLPERNEHMRPGVYTPFGLGIHRCMGSAFAETQMALALAVFFHHAELELDPPDYRIKLAPEPFWMADRRFGFRVRSWRRRP